MQRARINSIEVIAELKGALRQFAQTASTALNETEAEIQHTLNWLESDQKNHWQRQVRRFAERVHQAKEALRSKKLLQPDHHSRFSTAEEEKNLARAKRALDEAERKLQITRRWAIDLKKHAVECKGRLQPLVRLIEALIPKASIRLDNLTKSLDAYLAVNPPPTVASTESVSSTVTDTPTAANTNIEDAPSMARVKDDPLDDEELGDIASQSQENKP